MTAAAVVAQRVAEIRGHAAEWVSFVFFLGLTRLIGTFGNSFCFGGVVCVSRDSTGFRSISFVFKGSCRCECRSLQLTAWVVSIVAIFL